MMVIAPKQVFAETGIVGACHCGQGCDIVRPNNKDIKWFSVSCLVCGRTWEGADTIQGAVDNFGHDRRLV